MSPDAPSRGKISEMPDANDIISHAEMCLREKASLQRGMNFNLGRTYSVILMSVRPGAPYHDRFEEDGMVLVYEGHDVTKRENPSPKTVDQPEFLRMGSFSTQRGGTRMDSSTHILFACTKKLEKGSGTTTDFSNWWMYGKSSTADGKSSSSSSCSRLTIEFRKALILSASTTV